MRPGIYQALAIAAGLRLYAKSGIKPNRMWSPKAMRLKAEQITGKKFKARDYTGMADALSSWAKENATPEAIAEKPPQGMEAETVS